MSFFKRKYRIVTDSYAGYEVQHKYWWCPFWIQTDYTNTHGSIHEAERFIELIKKRNNQRNKVIKYIE